MATPTIVATPGAGNANSYPTLAEANTYFDSRLHSEAWTAASVADQTIALIEATRLLDRLYTWASWTTQNVPRSQGGQILQWPRTGVLDERYRDFIGNDEIPLGLKNATAEFAMQLITEDRTLDLDIETKGIQSLSAGPVSISFGSVGSVRAKVVPDAVVNMIPNWWGWIHGRGTRNLERA